MSKPKWDDFNMCEAYLASIRSIDPNTKCGCYIVYKDNRPLSLGYNGPVRNVDDSKIPLVRPDKYMYIEHAERNAIFNAHGPLEGATCYVTSLPCPDCARALIQTGVKRVVYGPRQTGTTAKADEATMKMFEMSNVKVEIYEDLSGVLNCAKLLIHQIEDSINHEKTK